jgi:transketolase
MLEKNIYTGTAPKKEISTVFSDTLEELIREDKSVIYIDADLMASMKTKRLWDQYPQQVINTGIQEANMVGVAAGMFLTGMKPYIHSFSPFITRRVFDQLFISIGYAHKSVRVIGSDAGISATANGGTHMCFEDIALVRTIPDSCIIDVSDSSMLKYFLRSTKERPGLTYFRTARRDVPDIYQDGTVFHEGQGKVLAEGEDATIIAAGIMVATALDAHKLLKEKGINARVVDIVTIKPLDTQLVLDCAISTGVIVTAENHNIIGGLGGAIAEFVSEANPVPVLRIGVQDKYGQVGDLAYLRDVYELTAQKIVEKVFQGLNLKKAK